MRRPPVEYGGFVMFVLVGAVILFAMGDEPPVTEESAPLDVFDAEEADGDDARIASLAEARLRLFTTGNGGERLVLDGGEITAVLRHSLPGMIPSGVSSPVVRLSDGSVRVTARIAADAFPGTPVLASVLDVLPDTLDVEVRGRVVRDRGTLALRIDRVSAERIPIPRAVVAAVVASLGAAAPADGHPALRMAWPTGITAMNVQGDRLVLERAAPAFAEPAGEGEGP